VPKIGEYVSRLLARAFFDGALPAAFLSEAFAHLRECETPSTTALALTLAVLKAFVEASSQDLARAFYADAKLDLLAAMPKERAEGGAPAVAAALEEAGLAFLDPQLANEVQAKKQEEQKEALASQLREIETYLMQALKGGEAEGAVMEWMAKRIDAATPDAAVCRVVMRCLLETSSDDTPPSSTKINGAIKEHAKLLRKFLHAGKAADQMPLMCASLYEVQAYCLRKNWPDKLMKKLFYQLYEQDIILEEAYGVWREDTETDEPGKDRALFQVNEFLQWLETTEEEGEEDDEEAP